MRQEEKNHQSRERILNAAIEEFGEKGYTGVSLNTLLSDNGLSKGLVYHYFENKDQLYLGCVSACFCMLMTFLSQVERGESGAAVLRSYFEMRNRFFQEYPMLERVFFGAILQPPAHLEHELAEVCADFETFNHNLFRTVLGGLCLREGVSEEDALRYFDLMQSAVHLHYRAEADQYNEQARKTVELLLYGLAGGEPS